jgi:hypothetical protein
MIEKTVIILGAGASKDYGFPVGNALIENILNKEENGFCTYRETNELGTQNRIFDFKDLEQLLNEMSSSEDEKSNIKNTITRYGGEYLRMNQFELIRKMRNENNAPVDTMGCDAIASIDPNLTSEVCYKKSF